MSLATELSYPAAEDAGSHPYRTMSRAAIVSLGLALVSGLAFLFPMLLALPLVGMVLGLVALSTIRRYPAEYTGSHLATIGAALCCLLFFGGATWHLYVYLTEVPEGYARMSFAELQPDPDYPELPVPPTAIKLSGQQVFVRGYMHPGVASLGKVDHFILVNDYGTCCFGGQPKPTHMIEIHVPKGKERLAYSRSVVKLAGTFGVSPVATDSLGLSSVWYHLQVDQVR